MSGPLRWVAGDGEWHLRFGPSGPMLCDRQPGTTPTTRWLSRGAPAGRCPKCSEVIRFRLGLGGPRELQLPTPAQVQMKRLIAWAVVGFIVGAVTVYIFRGDRQRWFGAGFAEGLAVGEAR